MEQFLEYFGLVVGSWYGMLALIAFGLTLGFQAARRRMGGRRYRALWGIMLVLGGMWGGFALWQYVQNFVHWYDAYFLIPGVLVWVGLAKLQQRLPWGVYLSIVLNIAVVIWASQWVMAQHVVEADPKSNGERLKFNMHEWLSGRGWPGKAVPSAGSGGGPGVGGFVMLFPNGEPTLEW